MAQGSVFREHYSNQFDSNDPQQLTLALFIFHRADLLELLYNNFSRGLDTQYNCLNHAKPQPQYIDIYWCHIIVLMTKRSKILMTILDHYGKEKQRLLSTGENPQCIGYYGCYR